MLKNAEKFVKLTRLCNADEASKSDEFQRIKSDKKNENRNFGKQSKQI